MGDAVITADLHGKMVSQVTEDALLRRAGGGTYRLRLLLSLDDGTTAWHRGNMFRRYKLCASQ